MKNKLQMSGFLGFKGFILDNAWQLFLLFRILYPIQIRQG